MKKLILTLLCGALVIGLAGCASSSAENAGKVGNSPSPAPTTAAPMTTPEATMMPATPQTMTPDAQETPVIDPNAPGGATVDGATGGMSDAGMMANNANDAMMSVGDAGKLGEQIAEEVERLSEIDDAQVVVMGDTAIIAVEFDDQYKGEMTTRIQDMVKTRVQNVDKNIKNVRVTSDPSLFTTVGEMAQSLTSGTVKALDEIGDEFKTMLDKIVPIA